MKKILSRVLCGLIRFYQVCISPLFPPSCRFYPTCSNYALEAIQKHGPFKGLYLAVKRILRCNPYCKGGYDPVPEKKDSHRS
ncbi:MAG: membrane protein insertion efficiency factor YidD [Candidatus Treponema excrementipullorum]|uniref:Putative membrane protein insertion efficiency factor n=1 Tax=Candidatus Treponema excrementipullorum TaxID=2838768 RepID=A0A9E2L3J3_9SPIR|nr:membrane protein insertion efficiency factor YidD [Candidatus Treponema excrementipullorum]MCI6479363.1 membrane protein insertion efficiency factor YidD [Spirochaetia bacterium]MCI6953175.1 membrane protein insertion efficiency factor YidD [Spirochaetia bacterium]MCI7588085.1 membrane protein insertion efficiency factor YidD [Spirochaetia bacterium]MDD7012388.1 membrane protein insertion efficiency factor YidD [Candidatus Treponema excrementipullorum]